MNKFNKKFGYDIILVGYEDEENLGLRSIAAYLKKNKIKAKIEPYQKYNYEDILMCIKIEKPKIVGFSLIFQRMIFDYADLINYLRKNKIDTHITIGGHFPTVEYKKTLEIISGLDSVVRHEGEETLLELFRNIDCYNSWTNIKGIAYRKNNQIIINPPRPLLKNLDSLPFPIRRKKFGNHRGIGFCSILASRGCYYNCSFCSVHHFYKEPPGPLRRTRSPSNVAEEMESLFKKYNIQIFSFKDDDLSTKGNKSHLWIEKFIKELKKRKLSNKVLWRISSRVDEIDRELLSKLKEVGLSSLYLGIESGSNSGLKTFNKHYSVDDIYKSIKIINDLELSFDFGFMIFEPYSTLNSINENINFLEKLGEDGQVSIHFTKMFPYSGTTIAFKLKEEGRIIGTIDSPDYSFIDPRLNLLQHFFFKTYNYRIFNKDGLLNRLRLAKFDSTVLRNFFPDKYDIKEYVKRIQYLTKKSNESVLLTMKYAVEFVQERKYDEIIEDWGILRELTNHQNKIDTKISEELNKIFKKFDYTN